MGIPPRRRSAGAPEPGALARRSRHATPTIVRSDTVSYAPWAGKFQIVFQSVKFCWQPVLIGLNLVQRWVKFSSKLNDYGNLALHAEYALHGGPVARPSTGAAFSGRGAHGVPGARCHGLCLEPAGRLGSQSHRLPRVPALQVRPPFLRHVCLDATTRARSPARCGGGRVRAVVR